MSDDKTHRNASDILIRICYCLDIDMLVDCLDIEGIKLSISTKSRESTIREDHMVHCLSKLLRHHCSVLGAQECLWRAHHFIPQSVGKAMA